MSFQVNEVMMGYIINGVESIAYYKGKNKFDSYGPTPCRNKCHLDFKISMRTLNYKSARRKYENVLMIQFKTQMVQTDIAKYTACKLKLVYSILHHK